MEFDIAVVQGSQCLEIFNEYVDMHPGLVRFRTCWQTVGCKCGEPDCFRLGIQYLIEDLSAELAIEFAARCEGGNPMTKEEATSLVDWINERAGPPPVQRGTPYAPYIEFNWK